MTPDKRDIIAEDIIVKNPMRAKVQAIHESLVQ